MGSARVLLFASIVILVGVALRGVWVAGVAPEATHDARWYVARAKSVAAGHGYAISDRPTAYRPAGYPVLLGTTFAVFGNERSVIRLLNLAISTLTLVALYALCKRVAASHSIALCATALFALYPTDIAYTSLAVSEPFFNLLMLSGLLALSSPKRVVRWGLGGAMLCAAILTRAQGIVLLATAAILLCSTQSRRARWFGAFELAPVIIIIAMLAAPWWWRNFQAFGGFVPVSTNAGVNLYIGNNPLATGGYRFDRRITRTIEPVLNIGWLGSGGPHEYLADRQLNSMALEHMRDNRSATLALLPVKLRKLYQSDHAALGWNRSPTTREHPYLELAERATSAYYIVLWACAAIAIVTAAMSHASLVVRMSVGLFTFVCVHLLELSIVWSLGLLVLSFCLARFAPIRKSRIVWLSAATIAAFTAIHLPYFGDARFHHPMMPWVAVCAGSLIASLGTAATGRLRSRRSVGLNDIVKS